MRAHVVWLWLAVACSSDGAVEPSPDAPQATEPICGDGICVSSEIGACAVDCGSSPVAACGNGTCEAGESAATCPGDCATSMQACGNGTCEAGESEASCPGDCSTTSTVVCGDLVCDASETAQSCPADCGTTVSTCPGGDDVGCFFCWFDATQCIPPQTEAECGACLGLGP